MVCTVDWAQNTWKGRPKGFLPTQLMILLVKSSIISATSNSIAMEIPRKREIWPPMAEVIAVLYQV